MKSIVMNIPHAGIEMPLSFYNKKKIDIKEIAKEVLFEADLYVDEFKCNNCISVESSYTRMFYDAERLRENEPMDKYGKGIVYSKDTYGREFINLDKDYITSAMTHYNSYHKLLSSAVDFTIKEKGKCLLIDLHSFSDMYVKRMFDLDECPDICIGVNNNYYSNKLVDITKSHFNKYGYSVKVNYPFSGAIVPNGFKEDAFFRSIMIEINKRIYLNDSLVNLDCDKTNKLKKCMNELYELYGLITNELNYRTDVLVSYSKKESKQKLENYISEFTGRKINLGPIDYDGSLSINNISIDLRTISSVNITGAIHYPGKKFRDVDEFIEWHKKYFKFNLKNKYNF